MTKREKIYAKYDGHCAYCGKEITIKDMLIDQLMPLHYFKNLREEARNGLVVSDIKKDTNLMPSCRACYYFKSDLSIERFRKEIYTQFERAEHLFVAKLALSYGILNLGTWDGKFYFEKVEAKKWKPYI